MPLYIPVSGSEPSDFQPAIVTGNYYFPQSIGVSSATAPSADRLTAYPVWFSHDVTWTRIGCDVVTGSGTATEKIRLGIWSSGTDNKPNALLLDSGELSLQTSGEKEATISLTLTANTLYWIGCNSNDSSVLSEVRSAQGAEYNLFTWLLGILSPADAAAAYNGSHCAVQRTLAYGALPDPFGTLDGTVVGNIPAIWLRKV